MHGSRQQYPRVKDPPTKVSLHDSYACMSIHASFFTCMSAMPVGMLMVTVLVTMA